MDRHQIDGRILSSSINFEVELVTLAFIEFRKARTLDGTNVHEGIRLAVITNQKPETLHRIEEFDRTGSFFAGQFALGRARCLRRRNHIAHDLKILCRDFAATIHKVEFEFLPFSQAFEAGTFDCADMDENIFSTTLLSDEAKAFLAVEEFNRAFASANDLGRHAVETAATAAATTTATAGTTAAKAVAATVAITTTEAIAAAESVTTTIIAVITRRRKPVIPAKRIETVLAETVALVPTAPTSPVVTHILSRTLPRCPS